MTIPDYVAIGLLVVWLDAVGRDPARDVAGPSPIPKAS